jgi:CRISPR-associated endoribonuclease Cas6
MRLLIRLRCIEDSKYEMQYHYHLQGFIYGLLKGSKYDHIHDKEGYKFFCFSNVFPAYDLKKGDTRTLMVSSPNAEFVSHLRDALRPVNDIKLGRMRFQVDYARELDVELPSVPFAIIAGTPIVMRIPRAKYLEQGVEPKGQYEYVYWRSDHPLDLFLSQLEETLAKKYAQYHGLAGGGELGRLENNGGRPLIANLFQKFRFKKQVSTRVSMKGSEHVVIGTVWEFEPGTGANRDMVRFALDAGLGERNSLGFGFMNLI